MGLIAQQTMFAACRGLVEGTGMKHSNVAGQTSITLLALLAGGSVALGAAAQDANKTGLNEMNKVVQGATDRATESALNAAKGEGETPAQPPATDAGPRTVFPITNFEFSYAEVSRALPNLPQLSEVVRSAVAKVERLPDGTITGRKQGGEPMTLRLGEFRSDSPVNFDPTGIKAVSDAIREELSRRGVMGVITAPIEGVEVGTDLEDLRGGRTSFRLVTLVGSLGEMRTLAAGERVTFPKRADGTTDFTGRLNNPIHRRIVQNSPVKIGGFLNKDEIDEYTLFLGRHSGRRVDVGVGPGPGAGSELTLDYLVAESRPWWLLFQLSNTGTAQTNEWRQRFGFQHNQLTGQDDILKIDFLTASFQDSNALLASYEFPIFDERLRARPSFGWSKYEASDLGGGQVFGGDAWNLGVDFVWNFWQQREWFLDLVAGFKYERISAENQTLAIEGDSGFFLPNLGLQLERNNEKWSTSAEVNFSFNLPGVGGTKDSAGLAPLGRFNADDQFQILRLGGSQSFYVEPLFFPDTFAGKGLGNGETWQPGMSLAHEVQLSAKLTTTLGDRVIPNYQEVAGGFFTVRGYPENFVAGDRVYSGGAEYRLHVPRLLSPQIDQRKKVLWVDNFRGRPQEPYGATDWDLVIRAFVDAARVENADRLSFEQNVTLVGAGVGAELAFSRNFNARLDVGVPLRSATANNRTIDSGDARLHFLLTLLY
jgi:hemolysin activation/secretion protein